MKLPVVKRQILSSFQDKPVVELDRLTKTSLLQAVISELKRDIPVDSFLSGHESDFREFARKASVAQDGTPITRKKSESSLGSASKNIFMKRHATGKTSPVFLEKLNPRAKIGTIAKKSKRLNRLETVECDVDSEADEA